MEDFSVIDAARLTLREEDVICDLHGKSLAVSVAGHSLRCIKCIEEDVAADARDSLAARDVLLAKQQVAAVLQRSGIPERYWDATFDRYKLGDNPDQAKVFSRVKLFSAGVVKGGWSAITLYGTPGTGKTHLAISAVLSAISSGKAARYISFLSLVDKFHRARSFSAEVSRDELLAEFTAPDLLVIDEVGMIGAAGMESQAVSASYEVINARYNAMKPVIVCSNGAISELREVMGERVVERLRENGGVFLPMDWTSFRKEGSPS